MRERLGRVSDEGGISIIEVVIASGLFMCLMVAVLTMLDSGTKAERDQQAKHEALLELRDAMTYVSDEVRQAVAVTPDSTPQRLTIQTLRPGGERWLVFQVTAEGLTVRSCEALPCGATPVPIASRVVNGSFCYDPPTCLATAPPISLSSIRTSLSVQPDVSSAPEITLATDVELRNI